MGTQTGQIHILVDARTLGSRPSGVGAYLFDFVQVLAANPGFHFLLVSDISESEQLLSLKRQGIPVICYGKKVFRSVQVYSYLRFIRKQLLHHQPDIFWEPNNLIPTKIRGYRGRFLLTIHDLFPITHPAYFSPHYRFYFKLGLRTSLRQADAVLFDSLETRQQARRVFSQLKTIRTFVSYSIVKRPPARPILDGGFLLYIGNLERRKGTDLLIKAYLAYRRAGGEKLLYLGGSIRENSIRRLLEQASEETADIHYLGYVDEEKKYELLSTCSCFLFPSRAEGFGIPPLEAISYRKPIIASNLSIFREILKAPISTFDLQADEEEQIRQLSQLMLRPRQTELSSQTCSDSLGYYQSELLGKRLAEFIQGMVEENHENRV